MESPVLRLLEDRIASRSFLPDPVPEAKLQMILEAARLTPSCYNKQPWRFLVLVTQEGLGRGRKALTGGNRAWAIHAPVLIAGYSDPESDCRLPDGRDYHQFDLGMAVMNIMLEATHHSLTARPMAGFDPEILREEFSLEEDEQPFIMLALGKMGMDESRLPDGYKGLQEKPRTRVSLEEIARFM